jgi:uncharacterized membrane protein YsdA (DUF1294 family)
MFRYLLSFAFLGGMAASAAFAGFPVFIAYLYIALSSITFIAYALDKSAARHGHRRTPEPTLHLLALSGGWPGALIAQASLRHKSKKPSFQATFWLTILFNLLALVLLLSFNS